MLTHFKFVCFKEYKEIFWGPGASSLWHRLLRRTLQWWECAASVEQIFLYFLFFTFQYIFQLSVCLKSTLQSTDTFLFQKGRMVFFNFYKTPCILVRTDCCPVNRCNAAGATKRWGCVKNFLSVHLTCINLFHRIKRKQALLRSPASGAYASS